MRHHGVVAAEREKTAEDFFAGHPDALAAFTEVYAMVGRLGRFDVRFSKSQAAFRRKRGFAYMWMPGQYLAEPTAEVVLSIALGRLAESERFQGGCAPRICALDAPPGDPKPRGPRWRGGGLVAWGRRSRWLTPHLAANRPAGRSPPGSPGFGQIGGFRSVAEPPGVVGVRMGHQPLWNLLAGEEGRCAVHPFEFPSDEAWPTFRGIAVYRRLGVSSPRSCRR